MNNLEAAIMNIDIILRMLEGAWMGQCSEKEKDILDHLRATAIQLQEVKREVGSKLDSVRRVE